MADYKLQGKGSAEFNDVGMPSRVLKLDSTFTFVITPKVKFWRFGLRFAVDETTPFFLPEGRYLNDNIFHIEIAAGERSQNVWGGESHLYLQQYNFEAPGEGSVIKGWKTYKAFEPIEVSIKDYNGHLSVLIKSTLFDEYSTSIPLKEHTYFKPFAWADFLDFEIDLIMFKNFQIKLNPVKALTNQEMTLEIHDLMIFFGANNSGKSSILLGASHHFMNTSNFVMDYLGPDRLKVTDKIDPGLKGKTHLSEDTRRGRNMYGGEAENVPIDPIYEFWLKPVETQGMIMAWLANNFCELKINRKEIDEYTATPEVMIDNRNPKLQGTGVRMVLGIVVQLFCPVVKFLCIDEPELSLEPRAQKKLFELVKKAALGREGVPKKTVLIATHSHIFLDKDEPLNNYKVTREDGKINVEQVKDVNQLQHAVYNLLGNNPSDLFFPSNIIVVEGKSDKVFFEGVLTLLQKNQILDKKKIVFHFVAGIGRAEKGLVAIEEMLKTQSYIPVYREKLCGLFDKPVKVVDIKTVEAIRQHFADDGSRFVTLEEEAIEYYYPMKVAELIEGVSGMTSENFKDGIKVFLNDVKRNTSESKGNYFGLKISKVELAGKIIEKLLDTDDHTVIDQSILDALTLATKLAF